MNTPAPRSRARNGKQARREQNKLEKLRRIKAATRELFIGRGYDNTTIREIVRRANIGLGTIFFYATDKRDLLFLVYNDEQEILTRDAFERRPGNARFLPDLIAAFRVYYRFFAKESVFMRYVLRELTFYSSGREAERFQKGRESIVEGIERIVRKARERKQITSDKSPRLVAEVIFGIYQSELRRWLGQDRPDADEGLRRLRRALELLVDGIRPS